MATVAASIGEQVPKRKARATFAYRALLIFSLLYYLRPEDVVPGLDKIPLAKIAGGIALIALFSSLAAGQLKTKLPVEIKILLVLFVQLCLTIPFAYWHGGAFATVFGKFSKSVIVALLVSLLVDSLPMLLRLVYVQAASVAVVTIISVLLHRTENGRLVGALGGIFENPNDLAINIAMNWPLCLAFLFLARGPLKKGLWAVAAIVMLYAVQATYSRSGFLALVTGAAIAVVEFGIRGRKVGLVVIVVLAGMVALAVPSHYRDRLITIVTLQENVDESGHSMSGDSAESRKTLLKDGIITTLQHPVFGIGPGNFQVVVGDWHVAHNTYVQLGAEAGIPALVLFLWLLARVYKNLRLTRKSPAYTNQIQLRMLTSGLCASFGAYLVGAFFSDTAYELFPYYLVAYTIVLYRVGSMAAKKNPAPQRNWGHAVSLPLKPGTSVCRSQES